MFNTDFSNWKCRCHRLSKIMTKATGKTNLDLYIDAVEKRDLKNIEFSNVINNAAPGNKNMDKLVVIGDELERLNKKVDELFLKKDEPLLPQGCISHLHDIYTEQVYGRSLDIKSQYLEKGIEMEEDSITLYAIATEEMFVKNKVRKTNDWVTGEIDFGFENDRIVRDTKTTWDFFDFRRKLAKKLSIDYWWQNQGYMWLWDCDKAITIFTLVDTPERLIKKEKEKLFYKFPGNVEEYEKACDELEKILKFADIPIDERIIEFPVERDQEAIDLISPRVEDCRKFLSSIKRINFKK